MYVKNCKSMYGNVMLSYGVVYIIYYGDTLGNDP